MKFNLTSEKMTHVALALFAAYAAMLLPMDAMAVSGGNNTAGLGAPTALSNVLCGVVGWFTGSVGAGIATLAIIVIGIGALMGKVSWGMAIIVGLGVGVIFGAGNIVEALGGDACV